MKKVLLNTRGYILFETVLATAIFALFAAAFISASGGGIDSLFFSQERERAVLLATEGLEAARSIRDVSFDDLTEGAFGLSSGVTWQLAAAPESVDGFSRQLDITSLDSDRKEITSTVSWLRHLTTQSVSISTLLANWPEAVTSGDWSAATLLGVLDIGGNDDGLKVQISGSYAYVIRGAGSPDFFVIDISVPSTPTVVGSTGLAGNPRNIYLSGNYALVSSTDNSAELILVDVSTPALPTVAGSYDAPGTANASGVFAVGNSAYLSRDGSGASNEFSVINITNPVAPTLTGSLNLGSSGYYAEMYVSGSYAYLVSSINSPEFNVIDITNPAVPVLLTTRDLPSTDDGLTIAGSGNILAVGRTGGQVSIIDVTTPAAPAIVAPLSVSNNANDVVIADDTQYLFVANDDNPSELQIWDLTTPASPTLVGVFDANADLNGLAYDALNDQVIAVGDQNDEELVIIAPGP